MKPTKRNPHPQPSPRRPLAAYASAFDELDQALAKNTQASQFTEAEKTRLWMIRVFGMPPEVKS